MSAEVYDLAGVPHHTLHDLRHDGISYFARHHLPAADLSHFAGHKSISVTMDIYYRQTDDIPAEIMKIVNPDNKKIICKKIIDTVNMMCLFLCKKLNSVVSNKENLREALFPQYLFLYFFIFFYIVLYFCSVIYICNIT